MTTSMVLDSAKFVQRYSTNHGRTVRFPPAARRHYDQLTHDIQAALEAKEAYVRREVAAACLSKALQIAGGDEGRAYVMMICNGLTRDDITEAAGISKTTLRKQMIKAGAEGSLPHQFSRFAWPGDLYLTSETFDVVNVYYRARRKPLEDFR